MLKTSLFTPSADIALNKSVIASSDVNTKVTTTDTFVDTIDNQVFQSITTANTNVAVNDVYIPCNASGGAFTLTLHAGSSSGRVQPVTIKKTDNTLNAVTIAVAGATTDKIEAPWRPETTPTFTSITLVLPNEQVTIFPILESAVYYWRAVSYQGTCEQVYAQVYRNGTQSLISSGVAQIIQHNAETADPFSAFDSTTNYRFTVPVTGYYDIQAGVEFKAGSSSDMTLSLLKNGTEIIQGGRNTNTSVVGFSANASRNLATSTSDYYDTRAYNNGNARDLTGTSNRTFATFTLKQRY